MSSKNILIEAIMNLQDENGCWNVFSENDKNFSKFNYYEPNYKSTLWTLVFLAEMEVDPKNDRLLKPLKTISNHFWNEELGIYSLGKSHFPIPCLNGNMLYLHAYFDFDKEKIEKIIEFFLEYQRFDDGDFCTPKSFPYFSNKSCYGNHSCYWGVCKLFKGLVFIPVEERSEKANKLIKKCIDFILLHEVCYSSHNKTEFLHTNIKRITFPNMYQSDFLELLWLLKKENIISPKLSRVLEYLREKRKNDGFWQVEKIPKDLIIPFSKKDAKKIINKRAKEVIEFYENSTKVRE